MHELLEKNLNDSSRKLLELLRAIPPEIEKIKKALDSGDYSTADISKLALIFVRDDCWEECVWPYNNYSEAEIHFYNNRFSEPILNQGLHSTELVPLLKLLLEHGLDPNAVYENDCIMDALMHIDNEYVGADAIRLLLENGGRVDLTVDGERMFDRLDFNVMFDAIEQRDRRKYDALVHCWFVYLGFGAKTRKKELPVDIYKNDSENDQFELPPFNLSDLKDHRNYDFGLSHVENRGEKWSLHIFDKRTRWEVARL